MSVLIIGSGSNVDKKVLEELNIQFNYIICADGGLEHADYLNLIPDAVIGDFDSVDKSMLNKYIEADIKVVKYPIEKDYTDMELSIEHAISKGFSDIVILGATGTRLDHTLANILLIERYYKKDIKIKIVDNNNIIQIVEDKMELKYKKNYFVSIIPLTELIEGLTLIGFKYPLNNVIVKRGSTLCISNEIINEYGRIILNKGNAVVIVSKD